LRRAGPGQRLTRILPAVARFTIDGPANDGPANDGPAKFLAHRQEPLLQTLRFPFLPAEATRFAVPNVSKEKRIMRCRNMLMGSALALTGALALTPGVAQTTPNAPPNAPAEQSAPAGAPADQPAAQNGAVSGTDSSTPDQTASDQAATVHHRHHTRTASTESRAERRTTNDLNKQQLAQAQAADQQGQQMAQTQSTAMTSGSPASSADQSNAGGDHNIGPTSEPDKTADSASASSQQNAMTAENTSPQNMSAPSSAAQSGPTPVSQVQNAQQTLASAKVQSTGGKKLGTVQAITNDPNGTPTKVQVELDQSLGMGKRSVWINADQLQYEPRDNALTTSLSPDQLSTM
jgi:hypothetical protein